jgi:predicted nucleic acid-binding protein
VTSRVFLDSNVVLYLLSADTRKADIAESLLTEKPTISVQVLSEATNVCLRKLKMPWNEIRTFIDALRSHCQVEPITPGIHQTAMTVAQRHQLSFFDAQIVAAALHADCDTLMTEDLHGGLQIRQLLIRQLLVKNPFAQTSWHEP